MVSKRELLLNIYTSNLIIAFLYVFIRFIRREKAREKETLKQGLKPPPQMEAASSDPLPAPLQKPAVLPQVDFPCPFVVVSPQNTSGTARLRAPPLQPKPLHQSHYITYILTDWVETYIATH